MPTWYRQSLIREGVIDSKGWCPLLQPKGRVWKKANASGIDDQTILQLTNLADDLSSLLCSGRLGPL